ncbi:MAG: hypothetical protein GY765_38650 [bacterium]|nr:hypothetical protein [bacterium]
MDKITIVGSGASAVHFALSVLEKGYEVTMLDVGYGGPAAVNPKDPFHRLKCTLKDPAAYFLGENFESVVPPDFDKEIYGFPPNKQYVFKHPPGFKEKAEGFEPLFSFARGGLAQAWTGGSYPYNDDDLKNFPLGHKDFAPYYDKVVDRIGVMGENDDLSRFYPVQDNLLPPLDFDYHSQQLKDNYIAKKEKLNKTGVYLGRSRVAVLSRDKKDRKACDYSGRCIWGCPTNSLYVPSVTLDECLQFPKFTYIPNRLVTHFNYNNKKVVSINAVALETKDKNGTGAGHPKGESVEYPVETLVMAAGTLSSSMIYLDSLYRATGQVHQLEGLMDNRQVLVPFINLKMIGKNYNPESYQYHQLAVGFRYKDGDYIHGQVTTLKTALMQPVLQTMPLDWKTATFLGRNLHTALGVINLNYSDTRRCGNTVSIRPNEGGPSTLDIHYAPPADEKEKVAYSIKTVKKFFSGLGVIVPPGQSHIRPMGASVHYSGTLPMSATPAPNTLSLNCRSHDFENLLVVDGSSFPFLPAKNLTFTLMANAMRVADKEF